MELIYHTEISKRVIDPIFSPSAQETIISSNHRQDGIFTGLVGHPEYHFDGNKFDESWAYVNSQHKIVLEILETGEKLDLAWQAFGRLLHAVQDFYAHSNYVKLWIDTNSPDTIPPLESFMGLDASILESPQLHSAVVYYPLEALTFFEFMRPILRPLLPMDSHANMNLDSPEMGDLFPFAVEGASQRSQYEYRRIIDQLSPENIQRFHGKSP